jgi:hypothetical protein
MFSVCTYLYCDLDFFSYRASEACETVLAEDETEHNEIVQSPNRTIIEDHTTRMTDEDMTTVLRSRYQNRNMSGLNTNIRQPMLKQTQNTFWLL